MNNKQEAKNKIEKLVRLFEENINNPDMDETMIRRQFVTPLFIAFGWDVYNQELRPLNERLVYEEERISIGEHKKRPDYSFFDTSGTKIFYVEAKKPKVKLQTAIEPAFQVRRYGWTSGLIISVLTNFEEFAIYNTRSIEPFKLDQPTKARIDYFKYTDYVEKFDYFWNIFAFENVINGSITNYAKQKHIISDTPIKGSISVDEAFLRDIESWRTHLAKNIALRNKNITKPELNYAVQKIIDRIIFLRIAEDRDIQPFGSLQTAATNYETLAKLFQDADKKYNSELFHYTDKKKRGIPDTLTQSLIIDNRTIQDIINPLYDGCKYAFDAMPAYILGSVYERFLGKEIELSNKSVIIAEKPEVRKAGGVYYTPEYIVKYIVENTIPKRPDVKILDPACGSGSFLLVAYQYMLDYYQKKKKEQLTLSERKEILLEHIFGVDLDEQAVEVTKLSLLLKVLEGATIDDINSLKRGEKALPSLHNNIKCGNSLLDDVEIAGEKAFVWEREFPDIFAHLTASNKQPSGCGFDVVIGNPPYVNIANIDNEDYRKYYKQNYKTATNKVDLYSLFTERNITKLLKPKGKLGYIFSNSWLGTSSFLAFRKMLINETKVRKLVKLPYNVFKDATVTTILLFIEKTKTNSDYEIDLESYENDKYKKIDYKLSKERIIQSPNFGFSFNPEVKIKIETIRLEEIASFSLGIKTSDDKRFIFDEKINSECYPMLRGKDVSKYHYSFNEKYIWYKPDLMMERVGAGPRQLKHFLVPKILIKDVATEISATYDDNNFLAADTLSIMYDVKKYNMKYILAILNSKFINLWFNSNFEAGLHIKINQLKEIPIPLNPDKRQHNKIVSLVENILEAKAHGKDTTLLENKIDKIVYKLYNLTDEEIEYAERK